MATAPLIPSQDEDEEIAADLFGDEGDDTGLDENLCTLQLRPTKPRKHNSISTLSGPHELHLVFPVMGQILEADGDCKGI